MKGLLSFVGMSLGGWLGWVIGAPISIFIAFLVSVVGSGVGLYITNRLIRGYLP